MARGPDEQFHPRPLRPLASACALGAFALNPVIALLSGLGRWLFIPVIFATTYLTLKLANELIARMTRRRPRWRPLVAVLAVALAGLAASGILAVILPQIVGAIGWSVAIAAAFLVSAMGGAGGLLTAVRGEQRAAEARLEAVAEELRWQIARVGQVQWCQNRALSLALHGPVQSAVTGAAIRLDGALRSGADTQTLVGEVQRDLERVVGLIGLRGEGVADGDADVLTETLDRVEQVWSQIARIEIDVEPAAAEALRRDPIAAASVAELVNELTSNAIRHGNAQHVSISLARTGMTVDLGIEDDGTRPPAGGHGLGARMLEEMTISHGRARSDDGRTTVTTSLPVAPSASRE